MIDKTAAPGKRPGVAAVHGRRIRPSYTLSMTGRATQREVRPIAQLLSYRLSRVSSALSRSAALRYRRDFDVSLGEWRALALIAADPTLTLNRLARRAGLDKAQMSRVMTKLVDRGLVNRTAGSGRTSQLSLTESGVQLYRDLIHAANERDDQFRSLLSDDEAQILDTVLERLSELALIIEHRERAIQPVGSQEVDDRNQ